jgi:hypothetical protein
VKKYSENCVDVFFLFDHMTVWNKKNSFVQRLVDVIAGYTCSDSCVYGTSGRIEVQTHNLFFAVATASANFLTLLSLFTPP